MVGLGRALAAGAGKGGGSGNGGNVAGGRALLREAVERAEQTLDPGDPVRSEARVALAVARSRAGDGSVGTPRHFRDGLAALAGRIGPRHPVVLRWCERGKRAGLEAAACAATVR